MRFGGKQVMDVDAFHESAGIGDDQSGIVQLHAHTPEQGVVTMAERVHQRLTEHPMGRDETFQRFRLAQQQQSGQCRHDLAVDGHRQLQGSLQFLVSKIQ